MQITMTLKKLFLVSYIHHLDMRSLIYFTLLLNFRYCFFSHFDLILFYNFLKYSWGSKRIQCTFSLSAFRMSPPPPCPPSYSWINIYKFGISSLPFLRKMSIHIIHSYGSLFFFFFC